MATRVALFASCQRDTPCSIRQRRVMPDRASERKSLYVPVVVYGWTKKQGSFHEETATLLVNGRVDSAKNIAYYPTTVVGSFNMKGIVRGSRRLAVRSWREGHGVERLAVDMDDIDRFRVSDPVTVAVEPGALGIPWYYGVYRR